MEEEVNQEDLRQPTEGPVVALEDLLPFFVVIKALAPYVLGVAFLVALGVETVVAIVGQLVVPVVVEFAVVIHIAVVVEKLERHCCDVAAVAVDAIRLVELHAELPELELVEQPASNLAREVAVVHQN